MTTFKKEKQGMKEKVREKGEKKRGNRLKVRQNEGGRGRRNCNDFCSNVFLSFM